MSRETIDDEAFLLAIGDRWNDSLPKLIYADWLMEHYREDERAFWQEAAAQEWSPYQEDMFQTYQWWSVSGNNYIPPLPDYQRPRNCVIPDPLMRVLAREHGINHWLPWCQSYREAIDAWRALRYAWIEINWPKLKKLRENYENA